MGVEIFREKNNGTNIQAISTSKMPEGAKEGIFNLLGKDRGPQPPKAPSKPERDYEKKCRLLKGEILM